MADYPNKKLKQENIPVSEGHEGKVVDSSIEGRQEPSDTIRSGAKTN